MEQDSILEALSHLLFDLANPDEWDQTDPKNWEAMQEDVVKAITYITKDN